MNYSVIKHVLSQAGFQASEVHDQLRHVIAEAYLTFKSGY